MSKVPTKEDFDCLCCQTTGFMRTQILAVAASLRLAEHLQEPPAFLEGANDGIIAIRKREDQA